MVVVVMGLIVLGDVSSEGDRGGCSNGVDNTW